MLKKEQEVSSQKAQKVEEKKTEDVSYWELMVNGIVRPPRAKYNISQLGTLLFYRRK